MQITKRTVLIIALNSGFISSKTHIIRFIRGQTSYLLSFHLSLLAFSHNSAELSEQSAFPSDHIMFLNVTSVDDVLVFGDPRELVPYNTQQTTAKLTQNTSCGVFFFCFSSCLPLFSFLNQFWELNERGRGEAITFQPKNSQPFVWQELQRELKRVRIPPLWKNGSNLDSCKWYMCFLTWCEVKLMAGYRPS